LNILKYDYRTDVDHQSSITEILAFIDLNEYTEDEQIEISTLIYQHYQKIGHWIPYSVVKQLGKMLPIDYCVKELSKYKEFHESIAHFLIGNQLLMILSNVKLQVLSKSDRNELKKLLIELIKSYKHSVVQRYSLKLLGVIGNEFDIETIYSCLNLHDELTERELINICSEKFYNSKFAVDLFYGVFSSKQWRFNNVYLGIMNISKSEYFAAFLEKLLLNQSALNLLLDHSSHDYNITKTNSSIRNPSKRLILLIEQVIELIVNNPASYYFSERSIFFDTLIRLFDKQDPINSFNFFLRWIETKENGKSKGYIWYQHDRFLECILSKDNYKTVINFLYSLNTGVRELELFATNLYMHYEDKYIYSIDEIEKKIGHDITIDNMKRDADEELYQEFRSKLYVDKNQFKNDVFSFFNENYELLIRKATSKEIKEIRILSEKIIQNTNFKDVNLTCEESNYQYSITEIMFYFHHVLETSHLLGTNLNKYKEKILSLIPYMHLYSQLDFFKDLLGSLSRSDVEQMIKNWEEIKDDVFKSHGISVVRFLKALEVHTTSAYQFVMKMYKEYEYRPDQIIEFIEVFDDFGIEDEYLKAQLEIYGENIDVSRCINNILIKRGNVDVINNRFEELKSLAQNFKNPESDHNMSVFEGETLIFQIALPLTRLPIEYEDTFINLVEFSLKKYQEDEAYYEYANFIWKVVKIFYKNRIEADPMLNLRKLRNFSNRSIEEKGISLFMYTFNEIIDYLLVEHS
jgi:hypothetical protein